jgi:hypothetical protein
MVIGYLLARSVCDNFGVVYFYFNYSEPNQSESDIMACLLKQLLCQLDFLPTEIESIYEAAVTRFLRPKTSELVDAFKICAARHFPTTFVVLDGLDEWITNPVEGIISLVQRFTSPSVKVMLTMRPHLSYLQSHFDSITVLSISAKEEDIEKHIRQVLSIKHNISARFLEEIVDKISRQAKGM